MSQSPTAVAAPKPIPANIAIHDLMDRIEATGQFNDEMEGVLIWLVDQAGEWHRSGHNLKDVSTAPWYVMAIGVCEQLEKEAAS